jgi:2'-5' RNA ligase
MKSSARANVESKRLFVGIPIPSWLVDSFTAFQQDHRHLKGVRWVPDVNQHITVTFIGNVPADNVEEVLQRVQQVSDETKSFYLTFEKLECFPTGKRPRMVWARFREAEAFLDLAERMKGAVAEFMDHTDDHDPIPHVTLGRFKQFRNVELLNLDIAQPNNKLLVDRLIMWRSHLDPGGAEYHALQEFTLPLT